MRETVGVATCGLILLLVTSCSLIVTFDKRGRPCTAKNQCLPGFSCMVNRCIKNQSIPEGQTCFVNDLCQPGLRCVVPAFVCRKPCYKPFSSDANCPADRACVRLTDTTGAPLAACTKSECSTTCSPKNNRDQTCVKVTANVGVCLDSCKLDCTQGPGCKGNCLFAADNAAQSCQPLGPDGTLACLEEQAGRRQGQPCNQIDELCARGYACEQPPGGGTGVCLAYCDPSSSNPCPDLTDPATQAAADCNTIGPVNVCGSVPSGSVDACTSAENNQTQCSGDTVQTCDGSQWQDTTDCTASSQICQAQSATSAACVDSCTSGDVSCDASGTVLRTCNGGHWAPTEDCSANGQVCGGSTSGGVACIAPCTVNGFTPTSGGTAIYFDPSTLGVYELGSVGSTANSFLSLDNFSGGASSTAPTVTFVGNNASMSKCLTCLSASRTGTSGTEFFVADGGAASFTQLPADVGNASSVTLSAIHMRQVDPSTGNDVSGGDTWCINSLTLSGTAGPYSCSDVFVDGLANVASISDGANVCIGAGTGSDQIWTCTSGSISQQQACASGCSDTNNSAGTAACN